MNGYIQTSRMCEFIHAVCERKKEDDKWEFFLHKVWNKSWDEFCHGVDTSQGEQEMSEDDVEATIKRSMNILGNFNPDVEEGEV